MTCSSSGRPFLQRVALHAALTCSAMLIARSKDLPCRYFAALCPCHCIRHQVQGLCLLVDFSSTPRAASWNHMHAHHLCITGGLSLQGLLDRYFELLPGYQSCSLADLKIKRVLFGGFPCYSRSPLQPQFDRIIQANHSLLDLHICHV